jgi:1,2-diacylglycerol 3-beta-galactosyltransferase
MRQRKIALIYIDAGEDHRAAATALCEVIREQKRPWDFEMFSIQDLFHSIDFIRKSTSIPFQDIYISCSGAAGRLGQRS